MRRSAKDTQVAEFEKADLGKDIRKSRSAVSVMPKSKPTSILLPEPLIEKLRQKAEKRGIGYQTMLKIILAEQVDRY
jgi:predicted DNA binding CopG/RHH family protein